jgi:hypothetical protein
MCNGEVLQDPVLLENKDSYIIGYCPDTRKAYLGVADIRQRTEACAPFNKIELGVLIASLMDIMDRMK